MNFDQYAKLENYLDLDGLKRSLIERYKDLDGYTEEEVDYLIKRIRVQSLHSLIVARTDELLARKFGIENLWHKTKN